MQDYPVGKELKIYNASMLPLTEWQMDLLIRKEQGKFDEFISPDEGLFERNMLITKHKSHLSNP